MALPFIKSKASRTAADVASRGAGVAGAVVNGTGQAAADAGAMAIADQAAAEGAAVRKLRANERLSSVLKESTFGAAVETLERNVRFRLLPDAKGNPRWLALMLYAEGIGGLSEKTKRDEAKGSLVQQIISDQIEAIALGPMLEQEFFAIVPSPGTLDRLSEYNLLVNAPYEWIVFSSVDGELVFDNQIGAASYGDVFDITNGASMQDVIAGKDPAAWARIQAGGSAAAAESGAAAPVAAAVAAVGDDTEDEVFGSAANANTDAVADIEVEDEPEFDDDFYENLSDSGGYSESDVFDEGIDDVDPDLDVDPDADPDADSDTDVVTEANTDVDGAADDVAGDEDAGWVVLDDETPEDAVEPGTELELVLERTPYDEYVETNRESVYDENAVRDTVVRRFLFDDLSLTVDTEEFERAFLTSPAPTVNVAASLPADSTDWLGQQLVPLAEAANDELQTLRVQHDDALRQLYIDYTARHIQEVVKEVSLTDPESKFGKMMLLADSDRQEAVTQSASKVAQLRSEVEQRFAAEAEQAATAAAAQARATHMQVNRGRRDTALSQVDRDVTQDIAAHYENERQLVLRMRRADADLGLQQGKTLIFQAISEARAQQAAEEMALLNSWNSRLLAVVDENRKGDLARAETLAEQLSRSTALEEERQRGAERLEEIRAEHAARVVELEQRVQAEHENGLRELDRLEFEWARKMGIVEENLTGSNKLAEQLRSEQQNLEATVTAQVDARYKERITKLEDRHRADQEQLESTHRATMRTHRALALLIVVLVVSALAIGVIGGWIVANSVNGGADAGDASAGAGAADAALQHIGALL